MTRRSSLTMYEYVYTTTRKLPEYGHFHLGFRWLLLREQLPLKVGLIRLLSSLLPHPISPDPHPHLSLAWPIHYYKK